MVLNKIPSNQKWKILLPIFNYFHKPCWILNILKCHIIFQIFKKFIGKKKGKNNPEITHLSSYNRKSQKEKTRTQKMLFNFCRLVSVFNCNIKIFSTSYYHINEDSIINKIRQIAEVATKTHHVNQKTLQSKIFHHRKQL